VRGMKASRPAIGKADTGDSAAKRGKNALGWFHPDQVSSKCRVITARDHPTTTPMLGPSTAMGIPMTASSKMQTRSCAENALVLDEDEA